MNSSKYFMSRIKHIILNLCIFFCSSRLANPSIYRNSTQINAVVDKIVLGNLDVSKQNCPESNLISYVEVGSAKAKKNAVIICNVHARELITAELCVELLEELTAEKEVNESQVSHHKLHVSWGADMGKGRKRKQKKERSQLVKGVLSKFNLTVFYSANILRDRVIAGQYCIRKDEADVDLNRNYPTDFNYSIDSSDQTYGGSHPLSQSFTICLDRVVHELQPDLLLDIHSGEFSFYYNSTLNISDEVANERALLENIQRTFCRQCKIFGDSFESGIAYNDLQVRYNIPNSFIIEIYGGYNDRAQAIDIQEYCFIIFNPLTKKELEYHLNRWTNAIVNMLENLSS